MRQLDVDERGARVAQHVERRVERARTASSTPSVTNARGTPMRTPRTSPVSAAAKSGTGSRDEVESIGSRPAITDSASAASPTVRANGPI